MSTSTLEFKGITFSKTSDPITLRTMGGPAPDPEWAYTDNEGHEHRAYPESTDKPTWPTLKRVVDETYWCETCRDEHEDTHYECAICGETIEPGIIHKGPEEKMIAGPPSFKINGMPVSRETWDKAVGMAREAEHEAAERILAFVERAQ